MKLIKENQEKAIEFIKKKARDLELNLYKFHFEAGPSSAVSSELEKFQNPDGGFGKGLEPDLRISESSAITTLRALQLLIEIDMPAGNELVKKSIKYFMNTLDNEKLVWPIIPAVHYEGNQAPWWKYDENLEKTWRGFFINPTVEITACLHHYMSLVPGKLLEKLKQNALVYAGSQSGAMTMSDIQCYAYYIESNIATGEDILSLAADLEPALDINISKDPAEWHGYVLKPLLAVTSLESPFYAGFKKEVEKNLDFELKNQQNDGSWAPNWTWEGEEWNQAKQHWQGILTLEMLKRMKRFNIAE